MRIGLTCTTIEPLITQGKIDGIGTYTKNLLEVLIKKGQDIRPFSFANTRKSIQSAFPNGKFFSFSYSFSTIASLFNPFPLSLHPELQRDVDILHVTDHMLPKVKKSPPVVATICDAIMFNPEHWHWDTIKLANLKKWIRKKTIHWANHYITISKAMIPELVQYIGIKEENISVVYLGIHPWWFEPVSEEQKQDVLNKFKLPPQFIFVTGTIQHKKNLPRLIQAFLQLPLDIQETYPLVIAGRPGWGTEDSLAAIHTLLEKKRGIWLDYISIFDLKVLFQSAALYTQPSLHEGFGLTLLEAFASQTPVLTSNVTALPEIANGAAYLVDPYSPAEMSQALKTILTSKRLQTELIQKGCDRVKEFSWEKCAEETIKIYRSLL